MTSTSTNPRARQIVDLLKDVPLFAGLDHDDLVVRPATLARLGRRDEEIKDVHGWKGNR